MFGWGSPTSTVSMRIFTPLDRTIKVSLTERLTKEQIQARMPHNLLTLDRLIAQSKENFRLMISKRTTPEESQVARLHFRRSRAKSLTLVEELSLRTRRSVSTVVCSE